MAETCKVPVATRMLCVAMDTSSVVLLGLLPCDMLTKVFARVRVLVTKCVTDNMLWGGRSLKSTLKSCQTRWRRPAWLAATPHNDTSSWQLPANSAVCVAHDVLHQTVAVIIMTYVGVTPKPHNAQCASPLPLCRSHSTATRLLDTPCAACNLQAVAWRCHACPVDRHAA
jgi:hypothetical protein